MPETSLWVQNAELCGGLARVEKPGQSTHSKSLPYHWPANGKSFVQGGSNSNVVVCVVDI